MVSKPNSKQTCKIENRVKTKQREKKIKGVKPTWPHPCSPAGPAPPAAQPTWPPSPVFFPCQRTKQLGGEHRRRAWPPPAWLPPSSMRLETPRHPWPLSHSPWNPSRSPSVPIPPLLSIPPATERSRRHRRAPSRPPPPPLLPDVLPSSCTSSPTPSPSHVTGRAPKHRPDAFSPPPPPRIAVVKFVAVRPPSSSPSTSTGSM